MDTLICAYLAGVIDSDGYISVKRTGRNSYTPRVGIKQIEPEAVDLAQATWGGYRAIDTRQMWVWQTTGAKCAGVLRDIRPFLRIKGEQADNALAAAAINIKPSRRFVVPAVVEGEPLVTATEAAARLPYGYDSVLQAVRKGSVPYVRVGRRVFIPESFLAQWASRGRSPTRLPEVSAELLRLFLRAKALNGRN